VTRGLSCPQNKMSIVLLHGGGGEYLGGKTQSLERRRKKRSKQQKKEEARDERSSNASRQRNSTKVKKKEKGSGLSSCNKASKALIEGVRGISAAESPRQEERLQAKQRAVSVKKLQG